MAELKGIDLGTHLKAIVKEYESQQSIYGYPQHKFFRGFPGIDLSVDFHGKPAATPIGPAAGPHTQMTQNILLSFLGGGRIMELKTIQILDRLEINRPCIDARNVAYNVEWSQELPLEESYLEYVKAWVLLKILEDMEILGVPKGDSFYQTIFDISVGYDLKGIASDPVKEWLTKMQNAEEAIDAMLRDLPAEFEKHKTLPIDPCIASTVTLSTFHGCPPQEIEAIVRYLIEEHQFDVIVKKNPTILGYDFVQKTLIQDLGYQHIELDETAFSHDLTFGDGVAMMRRLESFAKDHGVKTGSKFTNTLVVKNNQNIFQDDVMYLSGVPLHVLAMHAMQRFRKEMGCDYPVSFSAGITKYNISDAVSCHMKPVSVCTDLLKTGGYTRMISYLESLKQALIKEGANNLEQFIISKTGQGHHHEMTAAGAANTEAYVARLMEDPYYHFESNQKEPPAMERQLSYFDCISCNKCLPVCPNAANFSIQTGEIRIPKAHFQYTNGSFVPIPAGFFELKQKTQIANLADFCNECGECDTYCPEQGGPYIEKPRFFSTEISYNTSRQHDGFYFPAPCTIKGRCQGNEFSLVYCAERRQYSWESTEISLIFDDNHQLVEAETKTAFSENAIINTDAYYAMRLLLQSMLDSPESYPAVVLNAV
ncbi:MAG: 4Fe-4S dicluster domain-containing protein [SAR324 cluster bacterium]|nr:4Fe-4S dicluster domain-containing protein [SAR324 cluster bacterium]